MLSVRNLVKIYKTKGGVDVHALDNVSLDFPETGMVFLLGKSGSGKSTLLNMIGGLDTPTSGEIIVKGKSSKDFSNVDFDSYRNTCIGFIFQEYNILNEFNVEQNIALALQLQGKKNDRNAVNELLKMVDIEGMGKRKPNTLSGGQKQRIAIARALIKEPEIIMADEPTGALDSKTGAQVLDTLKNLSKSKLVIIVSHDHEFAEKYGDRIIELKDGKIIKDNSKTFVSSTAISENVNFIGDKTVKINDVSSITEKEIKSIVEKMKEHGGEGIISFDSNDVSNVKTACKISESGEKESFSATDENEVKKNLKNYDGKKTKFIKSKLPASHAFKMGSSGLKTKPIRLIFTILLSVVAFTMFGVVSTMMSYDSSYSISAGLQNSVYDNIAITKNYVEKSIQYEIKENGEKVKDYEWEQNKIGMFGVEELKTLNENGANLGIKYAGVFTFNSNTDTWNPTTFTIGQSLSSSNDDDYYKSEVFGFSDCGEEFLTSNGFNIVSGTYPDNADEVMIPKYVAETIKFFGLRNASGDINSIEDLVGEKLTVQNNTSQSKEFTISGIVDTGVIPAEFDMLKPTDSTSGNGGNSGNNGGESSGSLSEQKEREEKIEKFNDYIAHSFHTVIFTSSDFYTANKNAFKVQSYSKYLNSLWGEARLSSYSERFNDDGTLRDDQPSDVYGASFYTPEMTLAQASSAITFFNINADKTITKVNNDGFTIGENDVYLSIEHNIASEIYSCIYNIKGQLQDTVRIPFETAWEKYNNRYSEDAVPLDENDLNAIFTALKAVLELDVSSLDPWQQTIPSRIEGTLSNLVLLNKTLHETQVNLKGFYVVDEEWNYSWDTIFCSQALASQFTDKNNGGNTWVTEYQTDYVQPTDAKYNFLVTKSQNTFEQTSFILTTGNDTFSYRMTNLVFEGAQMMIEMIEEMSQIFLILGGVIGGFAALMLFNFISVSISAKKKEIGVLRAVGARGTDVFKIFFAESSVIAIICFIISAIAGYFVCGLINSSVGTTIGIALLNYGISHVGLILALSFGVSFIATLIPVYFTAKKPPVESIRAL